MSGAPADTFPKLLLEQAARRPDGVALRRKGRGIWRLYTWRRSVEHVRDLAFGLRDVGLGAGRTIVLLADNGPEWLFVELAAQALGAIPVGIDPRMPAERVRRLCARAASAIVVAGGQQQVDTVLAVRDRLPALATVVYVDPKGMRDYRQPGLVSLVALEARGRDLAAAEPGRFAAWVAQGEGAAPGLMLTTSGTGGPLRLVTHAHRSAVLAAAALNDLDPRTPKDEHVSSLPLVWWGEQLMIAQALLVGSVVNFPESPETAREDFREISPTQVLALPRMWEAIAARIRFNGETSTPLKRRLFERCLAVGRRAAELRLADRPLPPGLRAAERLADLLVFRAVRDKVGLKRVRYAYSSGGALGGDYVRFFRSIGVPLRQVYGLAEVAGLLAAHRHDDVRDDTVGPPLAGVEVQISEAGEILARAPTAPLAYHGEPPGPATALTDGWLRTGDAGRLTDDGHVVVVDRLADVAHLVDGTVFSPVALETKLRFSPYVRDALVCGDGWPFVAAVLTIEPETTGKWAEGRHLPFTGYADLAQRPETYDLLETEVGRVNHALAERLRVRRFLVLPKLFDVEDEELTWTEKLCRHAVHRRYHEMIAALVGEATEVDVAIPFGAGEGARPAAKVSVRIRTVGAAPPGR